ncbi:MAG TPA: ATP-binding protein [Steroidobacteraceae bacterium]|jgi:signal transduction histidine kinase|nr:ATP-binding protein [Steroidobacteraceae bacterium]
MAELDTSWFSSGQFLPHGHCYMWSPGVLWMNVVADILIAMAYFTIPFALLYIARRRRDLPFDWLVVCFGVFIVACGLTHVMDVWNVWHSNYWLEGVVKLLTAAASVPTAILLWRFLPGILQLPSQRQLRDANESLARANRELEAFTASVSHDLRSPLTTIAGQAGLLELSLPDATDDQKRRLARIQSSVRQMSELIEALLVLSRISRQTLHREIVDVSALAESIVQDMRQKDPTRTVEVLIQPNMAVHGDRRLVGDLFQNLIGNAWKFTSKTGQARIEIGQSTGGALATLFIRDNGAGFDMAYEQKLFKPFQRLHGSADFDGSGVGLATVARIIDRHGGRIWAEGKPNEGAVFYFTLPTAPITDAFMVHHRALA